MLLSDGSRVQLEPMLVGRNAGEARGARHAARHRAHPRPTSTRSLADPRWDDLRRLPRHEGPRRPHLRKAIAAGKTIYTEKPTAETFEEALELARLAAEAGVKNGVVHDKLYLPGLRKLKRLIDSGFFGRILSRPRRVRLLGVRGRLAGRRSARAGTTAAEDGGGIVVDMFPHWNYVLENLFGRVESVYAQASTHIPERFDEQGERLRGHRRRRRLRGLRPRGRRHRAAQLQLGGAGRPRRARRVPGRRHARLRRRRAVRLRGAAAERHAEAGVEPRPRRRPRLRGRLARGAGRTTCSRTGSRRSGRSSSATSSRTRPYEYDLLAGARGVLLAELGLESSRAAAASTCRR